MDYSSKDLNVGSLNSSSGQYSKLLIFVIHKRTGCLCSHWDRATFAYMHCVFDIVGIYILLKNLSSVYAENTIP